MNNILEDSYIYNVLISILEWFSRQFNESFFIKRFLHERDTLTLSETSIVTRVFNWFISLLRKIFKTIKLDKLFEGSIFKISYIWCLIALIFAPALPTMGVLAITAVGFGSILLKLLCDENYKLKHFSTNKYVLIYAMVYFASIFTSVSVSGSLKGGLLSTAFILFYFVVINSVETKKQLHLLVLCFIFFSIVLCLYGYYQYLYPSKFTGSWVDTDMFSDIGFRIYSTLGNPNVFGEYLILIIPFVVSYFFYVKGVAKKTIFVVIGSMLMLALILTFSRGCWLGIMFAAMVFLILLDRRCIILIIIVIMLLPLFLPETIMNRFMSIGNMEDTSTSYRFYIYMGSLSMLKDYWLCGVGPGETAFNLVYPAYAYDTITAPHSHNLFLQILCDTGICGIVVFVLLLANTFKTCAIGLKKADDSNRIFVIGAISSLCGFFVQSMFDYSFYNYRVMFMFWGILAITVLFANADGLREE